VSIRQASSASANTSSYAAGLFWWLSPSACWVHPLRTADPALYLHHPYFTGPPNHRQWQGHWDCLRLQRSSPEMSFWALSSWIWYFQISLYHPALAAPVPLRLPLACLPMQCLFPHNPRSISLLTVLGKKSVSRRFSAASFILDRMLRNAPRPPTHSTSILFWNQFAGWSRRIHLIVDWEVLNTRSDENIFVGELTIIVCIDFVAGRNVGCWNVWTIWRQAATFMSRLVHLLILNKAKSPFWQSIHLE
jgi:hypothetical protein